MHPAKGDYQPPELFLRNVVIFRKYQAGRLRRHPVRIMDTNGVQHAARDDGG